MSDNRETNEMLDDRCTVVSRCGRCDREAGHAGEHRAYVEEHDDVVFWSNRPVDGTEELRAEVERLRAEVKEHDNHVRMFARAADTEKAEATNWRAQLTEAAQTITRLREVLERTAKALHTHNDDPQQIDPDLDGDRCRYDFIGTLATIEAALAGLPAARLENQ